MRRSRRRQIAAVRGVIVPSCGLPAGSLPNRVDARLSLVAVAVQAAVKTDPGYVAFFTAFGSTACLGTARVGALPDMVTIAPDGRYVLTANGGEPNADFRRFNGAAERAGLVKAGVRLFGRKKDGTASTVAEDLEPEYIAIVEKIAALGLKNHAQSGQGLDPNDGGGNDGSGTSNVRRALIGNWPVFDVSNPTAPVLATMVANRDFTVPMNIPCVAPATGACPNPAAKDLGPEGLEFVPDGASPTRKALLIVGNEDSGTTTVWQVE